MILLTCRSNHAVLLRTRQQRPISPRSRPKCLQWSTGPCIICSSPLPFTPLTSHCSPLPAFSDLSSNTQQASSFYTCFSSAWTATSSCTCLKVTFSVKPFLSSYFKLQPTPSMHTKTYRLIFSLTCVHTHTHIPLPISLPCFIFPITPITFYHTIPFIP